jgi:hypothetical protein
MALTQVQPGMLGTPQPYNFKNRIINGAMTISQYNGATQITPTNGQYILDRFYGVTGGVAGKYTSQQSSTAPVGFANSLLATSTSAYSVGASDRFNLVQAIEGFNFYDLGFGTANAKTITLSFWVQSSLTGSFGGSLQNYANSRSYPFSYTISSANTWTQISVTIAGDTSGTWVGATNAGAALVYFSLGCGSTYSGTAGAWAAGDYRQPTGSVSVVGTSGATFYITGIQLELGVTATSFDYRAYGQELALCQRYYERVNALFFPTSWASSAYMTPYRVSKRTTTPTITAIPSSGTGAAFQVYGEINAMVLFQTSNHSVAAGGLITMSDEL